MITVQGVASVLDRTIFVNKGPIVKKPLPLLTGTDLHIISATEIEILSGNFSAQDIGRSLQIQGSSSGLNDGEFTISEVRTSKRLILIDSSLDITDITTTTLLVVALANELRIRYEGHRIQHAPDDDGNIVGIHGTDDTTNIITAPAAFDLTSANILLNNIRTVYSAHISDVAGSPPVHKFIDPDDLLVSGPATSLASAILLANDLRKRFESHRQNRFIHVIDDSINRTVAPAIKPVVGTYPGPLTGPFIWTLKDPRYGTVANDPTDVSVVVNSLGATVDAVFGLLGAVVLQSKPGGSDTVAIDYSYISNPPARLLRTNSSEFNTNQDGNRGFAGLPSHRYRSRSHIIEPGSGPDLISAVTPKKVGWRYRGFERAYSALTNDPTTLLTNVPTNKTFYPVLFKSIPEITIKYDPATLPQDASDPWILDGDGTFFLTPGGSALTIIDGNIQTGPDSNPPFFHHTLDLKSPSRVSAAFRVLAIDDSSLVVDGVFTGVAFGLSDGQRVGIVGLLLSEASNLSSAIVLANNLKDLFNAHLTNIGSHDPNDTVDSILLADASNLAQLLILSNALQEQYSAHIAKGGGPGLIHQSVDSVNILFAPTATDLPTAIALLNELRTTFNAHQLQSGVHFSNDTTNKVPLIRQVGLLTNNGFPEFIDSWMAFTSDWTEYKTYRVARDPDGSISIFLSGDTTAEANATYTDLPAISDIDGKFDPAQQVFFGAIGRESANTSQWQFIRVNSTSIDFNLIEDNKYVEYVPSVVPEKDNLTPWITIGQGGSEWTSSGPILILDSSASAFTSEIPELGLTSGAYRGFLRLEPILQSNTTAIFEYRVSIDYYTFSLDDKAATIVLDDGEFAVHICFLQFSPSPPTVIGTTTEPYPMANGDQLRFRLNNGPELVVTFSSSNTTAASIAAAINVIAGFAFASVVNGKIRLTSINLGSASSFTIISGSSLAKIGISPGTYIGKDSNPEPRISWFGAGLPDSDTPSWTRGGSMSATMLGRTMRLTDTLNSDYISFTLSDPIVTIQPINDISDWKLDFRCRVLSYSPGNIVPATLPKLSLSPCGVIISIDEGISGKSVELHLSTDSSNNPYINLLSFNPFTGNIDVISQYAFTWNDGKYHNFNIFTSKGANLVFVLADGVFLSPIFGPILQYSSLNPGTPNGPSISFGSGGEPVVNVDLQTTESVVDWTCVNIFRDSKVSDPTSSTRRYVGLYRGGDPTILNSYILTAIDWTVPHTYRVVRNPTTSVSLYIDGSPTPSISDAFDVLSLPPQSSSFLRIITNSNSCVAFGSFSPTEISRARWEYVRYSIGKIATTDRIIPRHNLTNRSNLVSSPDHLYTQVPHTHAGFSTYSGGTPTSDFSENTDPAIQSYTTLGEGTPPIPKTQNLEDRQGLRKTGTILDSVSVHDTVNFQGEIAELDADRDDVVQLDVPSSSAIITSIINAANTIKSTYNVHLSATNGVTASHLVNDGINIVTFADAADLTSACNLLNDIVSKFNAHIQSGVFHPLPDSIDVIGLPPAADVITAVAVIDVLITNYATHRGTSAIHVQNDLTNVVSDPDAIDLVSAALLATSIANTVNLHVSSNIFHNAADKFNFIDGSTVSGIGISDLTASNIITPNMPVAIGDVIRFLEGPNIGLDRTVDFSLGAGKFAVTPILPVNTGPFRFAKIVGGVPSIDPGSIIVLANEEKDRFNKHRDQIISAVQPVISSLPNFLAFSYIHPTNDELDIISIPDAITLADAFTLLNNVKLQYNLHRTKVTYHLAYGLDSINYNLYINSPDLAAITQVNMIRDSYLSHLTKSRVHLSDDFVNNIIPDAAIDLTTAFALINAVKNQYNIHRTAVIKETQAVHTVNDNTNIITAADAIDISTLLDLIIDTVNTLNAHYTGQGFHSGTIYIRLDPPSRVLYSSMKFYKFEDGESGHVYPISDDETLYLRGKIAYTAPQFLTYNADVLPESQRLEDIIQLSNNLKLHYNSHRTQLSIHPVNDTINTITSADATDLPSAIVLLIELKVKFNAHIGSAVFHLSIDLDDIILTSNPTEIYTATSLANELRMKFESHRVSTTYHINSDITNIITVSYVMPVANKGWQRVDGDGITSAVIQTSGPDQFLRYRISDSTSVYKIATGIPDAPTLGLTMTVRMRINIFTYDPNIETSIYAGLLSNIGPGVAAAIGFDALSNIPYVKIQDVNANKPLLRIPFNWSDGFFHTYQMVRDPGGGFGMIILE